MNDTIRNNHPLRTKTNLLIIFTFLTLANFGYGQDKAQEEAEKLETKSGQETQTFDKTNYFVQLGTGTAPVQGGTYKFTSSDETTITIKSNGGSVFRTGKKAEEMSQDRGRSESVGTSMSTSSSSKNNGKIDIETQGNLKIVTENTNQMETKQVRNSEDDNNRIDAIFHASSEGQNSLTYNGKNHNLTIKDEKKLVSDAFLSNNKYGEAGNITLKDVNKLEIELTREDSNGIVDKGQTVNVKAKELKVTVKGKGIYSTKENSQSSSAEPKGRSSRSQDTELDITVKDKITVKAKEGLVTEGNSRILLYAEKLDVEATDSGVSSKQDKSSVSLNVNELILKNSGVKASDKGKVDFRAGDKTEIKANTKDAVKLENNAKFELNNISEQELKENRNSMSQKTMKEENSTEPNIKSKTFGNVDISGANGLVAKNKSEATIKGTDIKISAEGKTQSSDRVMKASSETSDNGIYSAINLENGSKAIIQTKTNQQTDEKVQAKSGMTSEQSNQGEKIIIKSSYDGIRVKNSDLTLESGGDLEIDAKSSAFLVKWDGTKTEEKKNRNRRDTEEMVEEVEVNTKDYELKTPNHKITVTGKSAFYLVREDKQEKKEMSENSNDGLLTLTVEGKSITIKAPESSDSTTENEKDKDFFDNFGSDKSKKQATIGAIGKTNIKIKADGGKGNIKIEQGGKNGIVARGDEKKAEMQTQDSYTSSDAKIEIEGKDIEITQKSKSEKDTIFVGAYHNGEISLYGSDKVKIEQKSGSDEMKAVKSASSSNDESVPAVSAESKGKADIKAKKLEISAEKIALFAKRDKNTNQSQEMTTKSSERTSTIDVFGEDISIHGDIKSENGGKVTVTKYAIEDNSQMNTRSSETKKPKDGNVLIARDNQAQSKYKPIMLEETETVTLKSSKSSSNDNSKLAENPLEISAKSGGVTTLDFYSYLDKDDEKKTKQMEDTNSVKDSLIIAKFHDYRGKETDKGTLLVAGSKRTTIIPVGSSSITELGLNGGKVDLAVDKKAKLHVNKLFGSGEYNFYVNPENEGDGNILYVMEYEPKNGEPDDSSGTKLKASEENSRGKQKTESVEGKNTVTFQDIDLKKFKAGTKVTFAYVGKNAKEKLKFEPKRGKDNKFYTEVMDDDKQPRAMVVTVEEQGVQNVQLEIKDEEYKSENQEIQKAKSSTTAGTTSSDETFNGKYKLSDYNEGKKWYIMRPGNPSEEKEQMGMEDNSNSSGSGMNSNSDSGKGEMGGQSPQAPSGNDKDMGGSQAGKEPDKGMQGENGTSQDSSSSGMGQSGKESEKTPQMPDSSGKNEGMSN